jgi:hypothetical protein
MITYEDLERVNSGIQTIDVKEKAYATVSQRIKAFRKLFPTGTIVTELVSNENGVCVIHATVGYTEDGEFIILGEGTAYEKENSSFINKASYIENCETSAVGRALGMCGLGIDNDVASAEEVQTANLNTETITAEQKKALLKMMNEDKIPGEYICSLYGVSEVKELTVPKYTNLVTNWEKMKKKFNDRNNS